MTTTTKKLYRSRTDRMIAGVCGGLGHYLDVDPTVIRLAFVLSTLFLGVGPLIYLAFWILVPSRPKAARQDERVETVVTTRRR